LQAKVGHGFSPSGILDRRGLSIALLALQAAGKFKKRLAKKAEDGAMAGAAASPSNLSTPGMLKTLTAVGKFKKAAKRVPRKEEGQDEESKRKSFRKSMEARKSLMSAKSDHDEEDFDDLGEDGGLGSSRSLPQSLQRSSSAPAMAYEKTTISVTRMRSWAGAQREEYDAYWREERAIDKGIFPGSDADRLRGLLVHRHGTCVCGWRLAIDKRNMHRIGSAEFYAALRRLGYSGSAQAAWKELTASRSMITLADLDTEGARCLSDFYRAFREQVGRISELVAGSDCQRVDKESFLKKTYDKRIRGIGAMHYAVDFKATFRYLQTVKGFVTLTDCEWLENYCERGKRKKKEVEDVTKVEERAARAARSAGKQAVKEFRALLQHKYGSVTNAWHKALDPQGRGQIRIDDLSGFCTKNGYKRDLKDLLEGLTGGEQYFVKLEDLEPAAVRALEGFKKACEDRFGSVVEAFRQLEAERKPLVSQEEFTRWCKEVYQGPGSHKTLWRYLDEDDKGTIVLDAIDEGAVLQLYDKEFGVFSKANWDKAKETLAEMESRAAKPERPTLLQREIERSAANKRVESGKPHLQSLTAHCEARFGSLIRAWQAVFDLKGTGKVTKTQFYVGCKSAGYTGNLDAVWADLGKSTSSSTVKYKDLDAHAADEIRKFKELAVDRYITIHDALAKVSTSKSKANPKVTLDEFSKLCSRLGIDKEKHERLFAVLDAPGRKLLSAKSLEWLNDTRDTEEKALSSQLVTLTTQRKNLWDDKLKHLRPPSRAAALEKQGAKLEEGREKRKAHTELAGSREQLLRTLCGSKFAGITRGWQLALDTEREGELNLEEFTTGMQRVGLLSPNADDAEHDKVDRLFELLDEDKLKSVTLSNLDRGATSTALSVFRQRCERRFGGLQQAFQEFDPTGSGECTTKDFRHMCHVLNCPDHAHRLLQLLDPEENGSVKFEEIDREVADAAKEFTEELAASKKRILRIRKKQRGAHMYKETPAIGVQVGPEVRAKERELQPARQMVKDLRLQLCHRYGSVPRAWRKKLSPGGNVKIGLEEFSSACEACKLTGDVTAAWRLLVPSGNGLTLEELEPEVKEDVREFKSRLVESYGSIESAIDAADADGTFNFNFASFKALCDYVQFRRNERRLFDYFDKTGKGEVDLDIVFPDEASNVEIKRDEDERRKSLWREAHEKRLEESRRRVRGLPVLEDFEDAGEEEEEEEDEEDDD